VFTWTLEQAGEHLLTLGVTDRGLPALSSSEQVTITVTRSAYKFYLPLAIKVY
jgi:hypothetical protein